jgi:hypothetical protein
MEITEESIAKYLNDSFPEFISDTKRRDGTILTITMLEMMKINSEKSIEKIFERTHDIQTRHVLFEKIRRR